MTSDETNVIEHVDPRSSIAAFLSHGGLHSLLKLSSKVLGDALDHYNHSVKKGHKAITVRVKKIIDGGDPEESLDHTKAKKDIHDWIEKGGITADIQDEIHKQQPQAFAHGGEAKKPEGGILHDHPIATAYPEQNMMLQAAKGRMSAYLNSVKPQKFAPQFAFDDAPDDTEQKKKYDRALEIAAHPLSVLDKVHKGTIEPEHVTHLKNLHPEVDDVLQKRLTEKIMESQLSGKKPPYQVRQGLSLLLGGHLSKELTPQSVQAAQSTFSNKQQQQPAGQPVTKNKKSTSSLTKVDQAYLTGNQARAERQQKE